MKDAEANEQIEAWEEGSGIPNREGEKLMIDLFEIMDRLTEISAIQYMCRISQAAAISYANYRKRTGTDRSYREDITFLHTYSLALTMRDIEEHG